MKVTSAAGKPYGAKVDEDNRLHTKSVSATEVFSSNLKGDAFFMSTNLLSMGTGEHKILYLKNTSDTDTLVIDGITMSHNGGTTTKTLTANVKYYLQDTTSANNTAGYIYSLNGNSGKSLTATFEYWDGVGTGMTASGGVNIHSDVRNNGTSIQPLPGNFLIASGQSLTVSLECTEAFVGSCMIFAHILREI